MLYLRTGANGSCKTLFTLADVRKLQLDSGRPVAWNGRFKLKPEIEKEFGWKRIEFKDWQAEPDGTIFLIDECHNDLPKRAPSVPVPGPVKMLAEHRARGFDFYLLTQHPMNIDEFVRRLIGAPGWHQHLKRVMGGTKATTVLQWDAVNPQCEKDRSGKTAQSSLRVQPSEVYDWYDSATLHTAKTRIPKQVWYFLGAVLLVPVLGYLAVMRVMQPQGNAAGAQSVSGPVSGASQSSGSGSGSGSDRKPMTVTEYVASYKPRLPGLMHTAPAYDKLTEPKRVPVPAACVEMRSVGCKCYTQDATPYPVDLSMCRQLVANGAFLAFQAEGERAAQVPPPMPRQVTETVLAAPVGPALIDGGVKLPGAPTALAAAAAPAPQPRVQPGSKWSFQTGGQ
ncbi:zonular occludens toxin domain-containing protein [Variovorax sp. Varisp36]|uniref:zonular occludens toxin domain-containing protein n=1 Tax=Variovorax sp. Varisp36 TaxID=3243031 RepID=UPI0039A5E880